MSSIFDMWNEGKKAADIQEAQRASGSYDFAEGLISALSGNSNKTSGDQLSEEKAKRSPLFPKSKSIF